MSPVLKMSDVARKLLALEDQGFSDLERWNALSREERRVVSRGFRQGGRLITYELIDGRIHRKVKNGGGS